MKTNSIRNNLVTYTGVYTVDVYLLYLAALFHNQNVNAINFLKIDVKTKSPLTVSKVNDTTGLL